MGETGKQWAVGKKQVMSVYAGAVHVPWLQKFCIEILISNTFVMIYTFGTFPSVVQ